MKHFLKSLILAVSLTCSLHAEIIKTSDIQDIREEITPDTLVLFNVAEVLIDTDTSLGTQAWRKYIRSRVDSNTHDDLTWLVFKSVPPKAVEAAIPALITELQSHGQATFAFTSRGRNEWYASQIADVDLLTETLLRQIGIDFSHAPLNDKLALLPQLFSDYFHAGIIYAGNTLDKGELLRCMLEKTGYRPAKIVFVDDKADSLVSVERALSGLNIQFVGYAYSRTSKDHKDFDPMVANIQLDRLLSTGQVLSDAEALEIKNELFQDVDPDQYLQTLIQRSTF